MEKPTITEVKAATLKDSPEFFTKGALRFFGQTMRDFKVHLDRASGRVFISAPSWWSGSSPFTHDAGRHRVGTTMREYIPATGAAPARLKSVSAEEGVRFGLER